MHAAALPGKLLGPCSSAVPAFRASPSSSSGPSDRNARRRGPQRRHSAAAASTARRRPALSAAALPDLPDLDLPDLDDLMPDVLSELEEAQAEQGAVLNDQGLVAHFKNDSRALYALEHAAVVADRSHWGRLRLTGDDRLAFLHGQSTADVAGLQPGQGCDTVFVTAQARCVDLATLLVQPTGALLIVSPGMAGPLAQRLEKYIFPADKVAVADISARTVMFSLLGPQADAVMQQLQAGSLCGSPPGAHMLLSFAGKPVMVAVGGGLSAPGYTFICDESVGADVWRALTSQEGVEPLGADAWEVARVLAGRPAPGSELTEDVNPLEAGLYHAVSVDKGCYIGQETIAKVHNRNAVKQQLWALHLDAPCAVGDEVLAAADGRKLGAVTSYVDTLSGQHRALALLKCRWEGKQVDLEAVPVTVGGVAGRVVAPPFLSRAFAGETQQGEGAGADDAEAQQQAAAAAAAEEEAEAARRAEKLRAMQERLAQWQAQQGQGQ